MKIHIIGFTVLLLFVFVPRGFAAWEGMTTEAVEQAVGPPNGKRLTEDKEIWIYSNGIYIEFQNGRVDFAKGVGAIVLDNKSSAKAKTEKAVKSPPKQEQDANPYKDLDIIPEETPEGTSMNALLQKINEMPEAQLEKRLDESEGYSEQKTWLKFTVIAWGLGGPVFLLFLFLIFAFRWVGAEGSIWALFLIALIDRLVVLGVNWFFLDFLAFPMNFQADYIASFIVMTALVSSLTYAKSLASAVQIVIVSKVAALVTAYFLILTALHFY